jgi:class 3 adenylate cyclase
MNDSLPTGTVTFLFPDIQGSTPLWEREPQQMAAALQALNATVAGPAPCVAQTGTNWGRSKCAWGCTSPAG